MGKLRAPEIGLSIGIYVNGSMYGISAQHLSDTFESAKDRNPSIYSISNNKVVWSDGTILQYNGTDVLPTDTFVEGGTYTTRANTPSISQVSIDLTTLSGWGNVADGQHSIQVVAKADGYKDSEKSTAVSFTKGTTFKQIFPTKASDGNTLLENLNQSKIYSIYISGGLPYPEITYLTYVSGEWKSSNDSTYGSVGIISQTANSVKICVNIYKSYLNNYASGITLEGDTKANVSDFSGLSSTEVYAFYMCLIEGTLVTLADGTTKPIEDITYDDELLVWNFYDGKFDKAKPCWVTKPQIAHEYNLCKFSNGVEIGFVGKGGDIGYHRIYNDELKSFTHTGVKETPIGTHTFAQDGSKPTLIDQHIVKKQVRYYNVGTQKHINIFTNGILTSSRISNKYAIEDMKYVGNRLISEQEEQEYINKTLERC